MHAAKPVSRRDVAEVARVQISVRRQAVLDASTAQWIVLLACNSWKALPMNVARC